MEALGTIASVAGVIDIAVRSISALATLRKRFKFANATLELLHGQLSTVKVALNQVSSFVAESSQHEQSHLLVIDLDLAIRTCGLLIGILDEQISNLVMEDEKSLAFESKVKLVLESKGIDECLQKLSLQMMALNLVITAFQARNPARQRQILEARQSERIFKEIKETSSSLLVLCDTASFATRRTKTTTATSKLSMNFVFDAELLQHRVYKGAFRSLLRRKNPGLSKDDVGDAVSRDIDNALRAERRHRTELLLCAGSHAAEFLNRLESQKESSSFAEPGDDHRMQICRLLISDLVMEADALQGQRDEKTIVCAQVLGEAMESGITFPLDASVIEACRWLAQIYSIRIALGQRTSHFAGEVERILDPKFVPDDHDIRLLHAYRGFGVREVVIPGDLHQLKFVYLEHLWPISRPAVHMFENINAIIYTVDLSGYNVSIDESQESETTQMDLAIARLDTLVNTGWYSPYTALVLLFHNGRLFKEKIMTDPLASYFDDYTGAGNYAKAIKYILDRFQRCIRRCLGVYSHLVDLEKPLPNGFIRDLVNQYIAARNIARSSGFVPLRSENTLLLPHNVA